MSLLFCLAASLVAIRFAARLFHNLLDALLLLLPFALLHSVLGFTSPQGLLQHGLLFVLPLLRLVLLHYERCT
jgi:hypothetical protein